MTLALVFVCFWFCHKSFSFACTAPSSYIFFCLIYDVNFHFFVLSTIFSSVVNKVINFYSHLPFKLNICSSKVFYFKCNYFYIHSLLNKMAKFRTKSIELLWLFYYFILIKFSLPWHIRKNVILFLTMIVERSADIK